MIPRLLRRSGLSKEAKIEHERLTSLVNSMADGVLAVDQHMHIVLSNGAALNVLDVNSSLRGKSIGNILHLYDKNNQSVDSEELVRSTKTSTSSRDMLLRYDDGSNINLYISIAPVHLGYGKKGQQGYVILMRDITREKSLEEERDEFISVVSHELRTPIAIAEGNISNAMFIAQKSGDIEQIRAALRGAHDQTLFLADMINDLATLSRAERGKLDITVEHIDVVQLMRDLSSNYTPQAEIKGLTLVVKTPAAGLGSLASSKLYVREVLQNFITNAIKYTEEGKVEVSAMATDKGINFIIKDSGIGISKSDQERIFDKFFRSEDYRTRKNNGTGLGLYVTMKLARMLHAEINLESELNKGSTFTVFIPDLS